MTENVIKNFHFLINLLADAVAKTNGKVLFYVNVEKLFELAQNLDTKTLNAGGSDENSNLENKNFLSKFFKFA